MEGFYDKIGGYHAEGVGYSPKGEFCGECGWSSCEGCKYASQEERTDNYD